MFVCLSIFVLNQVKSARESGLFRFLTIINSVPIVGMEFFLYLCSIKVAKGKNTHPSQKLMFQLFSIKILIYQLLYLSLHIQIKTDNK